jgi:hypothetical protein
MQWNEKALSPPAMVLSSYQVSARKKKLLQQKCELSKRSIASPLSLLYRAKFEERSLFKQNPTWN